MTDPASGVSVVTVDGNVLAAIIASAISLFVFAAGKVYEIAQKSHERKNNKRRLINALYTEISHNKEDLQKTLEVSPPVSIVIKALEEKPGRTIHAVYSKNMRFFDDLKNELHVLPVAVLEATVRFYNELESIYAIMDGFERDSFKMITSEGKRRNLEHLIQSMAEAVLLSGMAMGQFEIHFPDIYRRSITRPRAGGQKTSDTSSASKSH